MLYYMSKDLQILNIEDIKSIKISNGCPVAGHKVKETKTTLKN